MVTLIAGTLMVPVALPSERACKQPMVSFTFDDGFDSVMIADEILSQYGFKGVLFVTTNTVGFPGHVTQRDIRYLYAHGWEIGSHSVTHRAFTTLTDQELREELVGSKVYLESLGINVKSVAPPYGKYNDRIIHEISRYYEICRTGDFGFNEVPVVDKLRLKAIEVKQDTPVDTVKGYVDYAYENGLWVIFIFHRIDGSEYGYEKQKFEEVVKYVYCKSNGGKC